jgi:hypothetical protein
MSTTTKIFPEITRAAERYLEQYGDPLVMNTYLKIAILVLARRLSYASGPHLREPEGPCQYAPDDHPY